MQFRIALTIGIACVPLVSAPAAADRLPPLDPADVQIIGRVLSFQDLPRPRASTTIAVVYDPRQPSSRQEAQTLADIIDRNEGDDASVKAAVVSQEALSGTANIDALLTTDGVDQARVAATLQRLHIPCLTQHLEQVERGACTIGFETDPAVTIVLNSANAAADGIRFATAFCMMVRQV